LKEASQSIPWRMVSRLAIFTFVSLAWVVFRAQNASEAFAVYHSLFSFQGSTTPEASISEMLVNSPLPVAFSLYAASYAAIHFYPNWKIFLPESVQSLRIPTYASAVLVLGFALLVCGLAPHSAIPFIYFQF
ncbi:MAG: hypothetical protein K2X27_12400, partial [Candidatus Obscuribacterales bacterium]|nr:hypothetical protein [Candidatus Obscuribacterales bacterium]